MFAGWILLAAYCHTAGWSLSALHALNKAGYLGAFVVALIGMALWRRKAKPRAAGSEGARWRRRFRRPFPLSYLMLGILGIIGGALYAPSNFDALAYRSPRALQWLAEGQWHWIHTDYGNLNSRGSSVEWMTVPLFLFTGTDRFEFLINVICYALLPGRIFAILTRLGANRRAAWHWMWIFSAGYGFVLQIGSIGNDMFCALWPMGALEFALRARQSGRVHFVWISIIAAALMSSSKAFNLLLLPAWGIAILPALRLLLRRPWATLCVCLFAASASMLPTAALNVRYCGDWTGLAAEPVKFDSGPPVFHVGVNIVLTTLYNFAPPIFPFNGTWTSFVQRSLPEGLNGKMQKYFEPDAAKLSVGEMQIEEAAGMGLGVSFLLAMILLQALRGARTWRWRALIRFEIFIALAGVAGSLVFLARSGLSTPARYLIPFYIFAAIPLLISRSAGVMAAKKWWRAAALATFPVAALLLILSPARPLWPATRILRAAGADTSANPIVQRAWRVYNVYAQRRDAFQAARAALPAHLKTVATVSFNDPETSLWLPFGSRRVLHIRRNDTPEFVRARGIEYVLINPTVIPSTDEWIARYDAEVLQEIPLHLLARNEPIPWLLVRLRPKL